MDNSKLKLTDEDLKEVNGGNYEGYKLARREIGSIFADAFANNDFVMTPELASNMKYKAIGIVTAYKSLGYIDEEEYKELTILIEEDYKLWLERC